MFAIWNKAHKEDTSLQEQGLRRYIVRWKNSSCINWRLGGIFNLFNLLCFKFSYHNNGQNEEENI